MASLDTIKIITIGIIFNIAIGMGLSAIDLNLAEDGINTFMDNVIMGYKGDSTSGIYSAQQQIEEIKHGGTNVEGEEENGFQWILNPISNLTGQITNIVEGVINVVRFVLLIFTMLINSMFNFALIAGLPSFDNVILKGISYMFSILSAIINYIYIREIYLIVINRKWA